MSRAVLSLLLAALVFACLSPVLRNGFVGYDDPEYVTANPHVNTGLTLPNAAWAFTAAHSSNWHPFTWISHALDCTLFGLNPAGHHFTNLLLHSLNVLLLFLFLSRTTGSLWRSAFVALIFGLHPLHVESVAWVSERKDVLSTFFGMLALLAYVRYVGRPAIASYALVATLFAASLLAKPMLVTLPIVLLLLDRWPLARKLPWSRLAVEKVPLLLLSVLSAAATVWAQRHSGSIAAIDQLPLAVRLSNAAISCVKYLGKTVWPAKLAVFYPFPEHVAMWTAVVSLLAIAAASIAVFRARNRYPWLAAGWFWYTVDAAPRHRNRPGRHAGHGRSIHVRPHDRPHDRDRVDRLRPSRRSRRRARDRRMRGRIHAPDSRMARRRHSVLRDDREHVEQLRGAR